MAPLRLQIHVQPRPPSPLNSLPVEKPVRWLEIVVGDPSIQELCEILERRFFERNNDVLDIKILTFLDGIEIYPSYKVRDIFEDIKDARDAQRSFSTVTVHRNAPSPSSSHGRLESLPPLSLARPRKRPLPPPPLFAENTSRNAIFDAGSSQISRWRSPSVQAERTIKRPKIHDSRDEQATIDPDPDQPLDSLETREDRPSPHADMHRHLEPGKTAEYDRNPPHTQVEDSQRSPKRKRADPYGTPVSSQTGPRGVISIPDSPGHRQSPREHGSPEIPSGGCSRLSKEHATQVDQDIPVSKDGHIHDKSSAAQNETVGTGSRISNRVVSESSPPEPDMKSMSAPRSLEGPAMTDTQHAPTAVGKLQRPKSIHRPPAKKRGRRVINGVPQSQPSRFDPDPIDTSEGSSHERELLKRTKRLKSTTTPQSVAKGSDGPRKQSTKSPIGVLSKLSIPIGKSQNETPTAKPVDVQEVRREADGKGAEIQPETSALSQLVHAANHDSSSSEEESQTDRDPARSFPPENGDVQSAEEPASNEKDGQPEFSQQLVQRDELRQTTAGGKERPPPMPSERLSVSNAALGPDEHHLRQSQEELESKREAQATFDRIAAMSAAKKERKERLHRDLEENTTPAPMKHPVNALSNEGMAERSTSSQSDASDHDIPPTPPGDAIEEYRAWSLKYIAPMRNKLLQPPKDWDKPEKPAARKQKAKEVQPASSQVRRISKRSNEARENLGLAEYKPRGKTVETVQRLDQQELVERKEEQARIAKEFRCEQRKQAKEAEKKISTLYEEEQSLRRILAAEDKQLHNRATVKKYGRVPRVPASKDQATVRTDEQTPQVKPTEKKGQETTATDSSGQSTTGIHEPVSREELAVGATTTTPSTKAPTTASKPAERSPKAKINAARQVEIGNEYMRQEKLRAANADSRNMTPTPGVTSSKTEGGKARNSGERRLEKAAATKNRASSKSESQSKASKGKYTDSDALRAAGLLNSAPSSSAATPSASKPSKTIDLTKSDRSDLPKSMTPAMPSTRHVSAPQDKSKTPKGILKQTPSSLQRSVSFVGDEPSSSFQFETMVNKTNETNSPTPAGSRPSTSGQGLRTLPKKSQSKLTRHISPATSVGKGKEKEKVVEEVDSSSSASESSEASTFFSDESEDTRNSRAGPSSRKKKQSRSTATKNSLQTKDPGSRTSKSRSPAVYGSRASSQAPHVTVTSQTRAKPSETVSLSSESENESESKSGSDSESDSESESESESESHDSLSLLPQTRKESKKASAPSQPSQRDSQEPLSP
ncbi:MAG: hypothetical protein Q9174_003085, partial [Haloplaca sp. 1 TL-2023]